VTKFFQKYTGERFPASCFAFRPQLHGGGGDDQTNKPAFYRSAFRAPTRTQPLSRAGSGSKDPKPLGGGDAINVPSDKQFANTRSGLMR